MRTRTKLRIGSAVFRLNFPDNTKETTPIIHRSKCPLHVRQSAPLVLVMVLFGQIAFAETPSPLALTPSSHEFKDHDIGTTDKVIFKLENTSNSKLTVERVWISASENEFFIQQTNCEKRLSPQESCNIGVGFAPSLDKASEGKNGPSLQVEYSDGATKQSVSARLSGRGHFPDLVISPSQIDFGTQPLSTVSPAQIVTLTNPQKGTALRAITGVSTSGDFILQAQSCPDRLQPGDSCNLVLSFSPKRPGIAEGTARILSDSSRSPHEIALSGNGVGAWKGYCYISNSHELWAAVLLAALYWLAMILVRWNRVAKATRRLLTAQIDSSTVQLAALEQSGAIIGEIKNLFTSARDLIDKKKLGSWAADFLFWSRGQEIAGWGYVHEAEIQMAQFLPPATVIARLESLQQQLIVINTTCSLALANSIQQAISGSIPVNSERCRALLAEALNSTYNKSDSDFADLVSWQNKAAWLVGCGLLLIIGLSAALDHSVLFLLGATGGLLSRLSRSLQRKDVPTDYGASWTTLFLSPVAGALGGWAGVLLTILAAKIGVLGSIFSPDWSDSNTPVTFGLALLFGVSERAFDSILSKVDEKVAGQSPNDPVVKTTLKIVTGAQLPAGTVGQDYRVELKATGGTGTVTWTKTDGALPDGLTLDAAGVISNQPAPTAAGKPFTFAVEARDAASKQTQQFTIKIN